RRKRTPFSARRTGRRKISRPRAQKRSRRSRSIRTRPTRSSSSPASTPADRPSRLRALCLLCVLEKHLLYLIPVDVKILIVGASDRRRRLSRDPTERQAVGVSLHGGHGRLGRHLPVRR